MPSDADNPFNNPIVRLALGVVAIVAFGGGYLIAHKAGPGGGGLWGPSSGSGPIGSSQDNISCFFSPKGGCTDAVVSELGKAQRTVLVQAYSFTSKPIADALISAAQRGVKVTIILDKSNINEKTQGPDVVVAGIPTYIDAKHAIAHNKIMIIDGRTLITGSFNFTAAAEHSNAENLIVLHDRSYLADLYTTNFNEHLNHSTVADANTFHDPLKSRSGGQRFEK